MPWVHASQKAVEATAAQQTARPKLTVELVDNGDGTFSYAPHVYLKNTTSLSGTFEVTLGGETPDVDASAQVVKLRLGPEGVDDGLVDVARPMPTRDDTLCKLLMEQNELLGLILEKLS